ncbi:MAG: glutamate racemase [Clostridia bacterium]|nr:glutamate racemase [Clostridia bacterium]
MLGIFDSGLGGLTALKALRQLAPNEDIVYLGDTARVPYGTRSAETIKKYACECAEFLMGKGIGRLLVACGTVSANALDVLTDGFPFPVTGVISPASRRAASLTKNGKIAVLATGATVRSRSFEKALHGIDGELEVFQRACPLFVPLVENGIPQDSELVRLTCEMYLSDVRDFGADTVILGCTHYPIIADAIKKALPGTEVISSGGEAAREIAPYLGNCGAGRVTFYVTDDAEGFSANAATFLGSPPDGEVIAAAFN